jgi:hypothetical protein
MRTWKVISIFVSLLHIKDDADDDFYRDSSLVEGLIRAEFKK